VSRKHRREEEDQQEQGEYTRSSGGVKIESAQVLPAQWSSSPQQLSLQFSPSVQAASSTTTSSLLKKEEDPETEDDEEDARMSPSQSGTSATLPPSQVFHVASTADVSPVSPEEQQHQHFQAYGMAMNMTFPHHMMPHPHMYMSQQATPSTAMMMMMGDPSDFKNGGGSCHQCKTARSKSQLLVCTRMGDRSRKRRCRKKFCTGQEEEEHTERGKRSGAPVADFPFSFIFLLSQPVSSVPTRSTPRR
jgi:hypothetical protein